jgi:hypothetical protein
LIDSLIEDGPRCTDGGSFESSFRGDNRVGSFKVGQYARTSDGTVFIQGFCGGSYQAVRTDRDEEGEYLASDLTPWSPQNGERVVEAGNEGSPVGIVVEAGEGDSLVVWKNLRRQVSWVNSCLQPTWD